MINYKGLIEVNDPSIDYVSNWKDNYGNPIIAQYIKSGKKIIIDKQITGCGFTTYYLTNNENVILVSPRTKLINNKMSKHSGLFYFNREKDNKTGNPIFSIPELKQDLGYYIQHCYHNRLPMKFLCTYDSFVNMANILENDIKIDIDQKFRIVIDEGHALIKDIKLKQCRNKSVLSDLLNRLFCYSNLLFISATPLKDYLEKINVFQTFDVDYYEMKWSSARVINRIDHKCKGSKDAFDQIYYNFASHTDPQGRHYFDAIYGNQAVDYSYEAVIFLNDIADIKRILNDYVRKNGLIDVNDITILCAETKENADTLKAVNKNLKYTHDIPREGDPHKTWTFVTSTCFWGVDFCSSCASTFVIANYHVASLSLDIASDIPQIVGRQRIPTNKFRDTLHIFFTNNVSIIDDNEYRECQKEKLNESREQIGIWEDAKPERKDRALANLNKLIAGDPNALYVSTVSGKPEIDDLLLVAENYSRDIIKNHLSWFIRSRNNVNNIGFNPTTEHMKNDLHGVLSLKPTIERMKIVYNYFLQYPDQRTEFYQMLRIEGLNDIAAYFSELSLVRIAANGFDPSKMDNEIAYMRSGKDISSLVASKFESGRTYSKKEVKEGLQKIYDALGLKKKAKATELSGYIDCEVKKSNGSCAIHIK